MERRKGTDLNNDDVLETGLWCTYEGMYFTDEGEHRFDSGGISRGHYGYPCGDGGLDSFGRPVGRFEFPETIPVAIVVIGEAVTHEQL